MLVSTFSALRPEDLNGWAYFIRRAAAVLTLGLQAQAQIVARRLFPDPPDQPLRDMYLAVIARADPRAYRKAMLSLGLFDSRKRLGQIKVPVLIITGAHDTTVTPARQRWLVEGLPAARQVVIPQAGHAVSVDQPEQFNRALLDFLKE